MSFGMRPYVGETPGGGFTGYVLRHAGGPWFIAAATDAPTKEGLSDVLAWCGEAPIVNVGVTVAALAAVRQWAMRLGAPRLVALLALAVEHCPDEDGALRTVDVDGVEHAVRRLPDGVGVAGAGVDLLFAGDLDVERGRWLTLRMITSGTVGVPPADEA